MDLGGGGGAVWQQRLMVVALVAIIAGSVALGVYSWLRPEPGSSIPSNDMRLKCGKCKRELVRTQEQYSAEATSQGELDEEDPLLLTDCPECGAKRCAAKMTKCPQCGKYFVPFEFTESATDPAAVVLGKPNNVCPYCKTNRVEWFRDDYERRKGKKTD